MTDRAWPLVVVALALGFVGAVGGTFAVGNVDNGALDATDSLGYIRGRVVSEETGAPLEYSNVVAEELRTGETLGAVSGQQGEYTIAAPAGMYFVRSLYLGYSVGRSDSVCVESGSVVQVDFPLEVAGLSRAEALAETLGVDLAGAPLKLRLEVSSDRERYRVGDEVGLNIRIVNESSVPVHLPFILDQSLSGERHPILEVTVVGDGTGISVSPPVCFCGNQRQLRVSDLQLVGPGLGFNPWRGAESTLPLRIYNLDLQEPGTYTLRVRYLMNEPDLRRWWGTVTGSVGPDLSQQLRSLPLVDLEGECMLRVE